MIMDRASLSRIDRERITFAETLCVRRAELGMSEHEAARLAGIHVHDWRRIEHGRCDPSAVILARMAHALGLRLELVPAPEAE
jgi:transcriptional regulator with XRE-family HTH domain